MKTSGYGIRDSLTLPFSKKGEQLGVHAYVCVCLSNVCVHLSYLFCKYLLIAYYVPLGILQ